MLAIHNRRRKRWDGLKENPKKGGLNSAVELNSSRLSFWGGRESVTPPQEETTFSPEHQQRTGRILRPDARKREREQSSKKGSPITGVFDEESAREKSGACSKSRETAPERRSDRKKRSKVEAVITEKILVVRRRPKRGRGPRGFRGRQDKRVSKAFGFITTDCVKTGAVIFRKER